MKISVVIPSYSQAEYLAQAIESVLAQTEKAHEIIVVDDGSPDDSAQVAKSYPVKLIRQVNKGLSSARNTGIMNAAGDYIFFLDADDIMTKNCLGRINQVIEKTYADVVAPSFKTFGTSNQEVILMPNPTLQDFKTANRIGYFSAIKRSVLLEVGGYSPRMVWGWEDYALWFDLLNRGKTIVTIPEVLVMYRTKEHSMINVANDHADELWRQIHKDFPSIF